MSVICQSKKPLARLAERWAFLFWTPLRFFAARFQPGSPAQELEHGVHVRKPHQHVALPHRAQEPQPQQRSGQRQPSGNQAGTLGVGGGGGARDQFVRALKEASCPKCGVLLQLRRLKFGYEAGIWGEGEAGKRTQVAAAISRPKKPQVRSFTCSDGFPKKVVIAFPTLCSSWGHLFSDIKKT